MDKVLVTGGAGFIGSNVVDLLIENNYEVVIVDDLSHGKPENINSEAKFHKLDIRDPKLDEIFREETPDFVVHHAAQIDVRKSLVDPELDARINILGSLNLLDCCKSHSIEKIVYASTGGAIYGEPQYLPADEAHPQDPLSPYGASKLAVEKYLHIYKNLHGLDYIALRYANVYGPRQDPLGEAGVVAIFTRKMMGNENPVINGDGKQTRDFVFVGDVAGSNLLSLKKKPCGEIFNIGSGIKTTVNDIYERLRQITNPSAEVTYGKEIVGEVRNIYLECKLAEKELGWKSKTGLDEGLKRTVEWFREYGKSE